MLLVTTCREPCANTRRFAKALAFCVPSSRHESRGKKNIEGLIELARQSGFRRVAIINEKKGNPCSIEIIKLDKKNWEWAEPVRFNGHCIGKITHQVSSLNVEGTKKEELEDLFDVESDKNAEVVLLTGEGLIFKNSEIILKIK